MWSGNVRTESYFHAKIGMAIKRLYAVASQMHDEGVPATTAELLFIADGTLRGSIRADVAATNQALQNREWKAATVLGGATIEPSCVGGSARLHPLPPKSPLLYRPSAPSSSRHRA